MTRDELFVLLAFLNNVKHSEYVSDQMMEQECNYLIKLIEKEIEKCHYKLGDI